MSAVATELRQEGSQSKVRFYALAKTNFRGDRRAPIPLSLPAVLGRGEHVDVPVDDPWVSRIHCELCEREGRLVVIDLDSRHGVFLNGQRVFEAELWPGDVLQIGVSNFVIERVQI